MAIWTSILIHTISDNLLYCIMEFKHECAKDSILPIYHLMSSRDSKHCTIEAGLLVKTIRLLIHVHIQDR